MRAFRDRFGDAHLALSVFEHARHASIPSFVFGCTTPAYNELLQTRWSAFRDLRGVRDTLEEMRVNGVDSDGRTRTLVENIRRDVGERNAWLEDSMSGGEVWDIVKEIDRLSAPPPARGRPRPETNSRSWRASEEWKYRMREGDVDLNNDALEQAWRGDDDLLEDLPLRRR
ncbi:hypothetical protein EXIGLDRAFT_837981 [Exidia glandulosa HHB12029]|nr:hypothetical protein EXIGLDRAFT_837981 [Exidia glandulosa HHB12029]